MFAKCVDFWGEHFMRFPKRIYLFKNVEFLEEHSFIIFYII